MEGDLTSSFVLRASHVLTGEGAELNGSFWILDFHLLSYGVPSGFPGFAQAQPSLKENGQLLGA